MKIRNGFVSNSSSSSFVVYLNDKDKLFVDRREDVLTALKASERFIENFGERLGVNLDADDFDGDNIVFKDDNEALKIARELIDSDEIWTGDDEGSIVEELVSELDLPMIANFDVSSDSGMVVFVTDDALRACGAPLRENS